MDSDEYVVAFDPGETTGWARTLVKNGKLAWVDSGELSFPEVVEQWHVLFSGVSVVVVEDWKIYPGKRGAFVLQRQWAPEMIGAIRALALQHDGLLDIARQMAVQAKRRWPNARLRRHGYDATGHARDALRHLLTYVEDRLDVDLVDRSEPI